MNSSNFSDNAKKLLHEASVLAEQWNHASIESGHLLNAAVNTSINEQSLVYQNLQKNRTELKLPLNINFSSIRFILLLYNFNEPIFSLTK